VNTGSRFFFKYFSNCEKWIKKKRTVGQSGRQSGSVGAHGLGGFLLGPAVDGRKRIRLWFDWFLQSQYSVSFSGCSSPVIQQFAYFLFIFWLVWPYTELG
jgi:hypothetical protein